MQRIRTFEIKRVHNWSFSTQMYFSISFLVSEHFIYPPFQMDCQPVFTCTQYLPGFREMLPEKGNQFEGALRMIHIRNDSISPQGERRFVRRTWLFAFLQSNVDILANHLAQMYRPAERRQLNIIQPVHGPRLLYRKRTGEFSTIAVCDWSLG